MKNNEKDIMKRIRNGVVVFAILCICFCITTFALVYAMISIEDNVFETGFVAINLNDGEAVIDDPNLYFEPGMTIKRDFFIANESTRAVYYKLYFNALTGELADVIDISILDKTDPNNVRELYRGKADDLRRFNVEAVDAPLQAGERRELEIVFHLDELAENTYQDCGMSFNLCADAVQADHNPDREFNETAQTTQN